MILVAFVTGLILGGLLVAVSGYIIVMGYIEGLLDKRR